MVVAALNTSFANGLRLTVGREVQRPFDNRTAKREKLAWTLVEPLCLFALQMTRILFLKPVKRAKARQI
jgi:hypothetical protein